MSEIEALIFDCDGTLTDSMPLHYRAWRGVLDPLDIEFTEVTFYNLGGMPATRVLAEVAGDRIGSLEVDELLEQREQLFYDILHKIEPIEKVIEVARENRGQVKMGVASGSVRYSVTRQLDALGIRDWFECVVTAEDTEHHKPEPDVFLEAAKLLQTTPSRCRVYEDSDLGIEAAKRAGMQWVDVRPWYKPTSIE